MYIDSDKILSMSAQEYVGPSKAVKDLYDVIGIHCENGNLKKFMEVVPKGTESVVNYRREITTQEVSFEPSTNTYFRYNHQYGVALIPKKTKK